MITKLFMKEKIVESRTVHNNIKWPCIDITKYITNQNITNVFRYLSARTFATT